MSFENSLNCSQVKVSEDPEACPDPVPGPEEVIPYVRDEACATGKLVTSGLFLTKLVDGLRIDGRLVKPPTTIAF